MVDPVKGLSEFARMLLVPDRFPRSVAELHRTGIAYFCSHRELLRDCHDHPQTYPLERHAIRDSVELTVHRRERRASDLRIRRFMPEPRS
jgi:hypothetical protein